MKIFFSYLVLLVLFLPARAQFQNLRPDVWLRAEQFDYKNKTWKDVSGNNRHASKTSGNCTFTESSINDNPAVYFNGSNTQLQIDYEPTSAENLTVFTVYQSADTNDRGVWRATLGADYDAFLTTQRMMSLQNLRRYAGETVLFPLINTVMQTNDNPVKKLKGYITIGGGDAIAEAGVYQGKIAECLVFYRALTTNEKLIVQSYLAVKYGITLVYSDYVDGEGNTVWSYERNREYPYSIAGIGRDDFTSLYRKQTASVEPDNILSIAATNFFESNAKNPTTIDNNHYLIWSDNGQALSTAFKKGSSYKLLERKWLITAKGENISNLPVSLMADTKEFFSLEKDSILYIAISRKNDATFKDVEYIPSGSIDAAGYARFDNLRWDTDKSGNDLFTFAVLPKKQYADDEQDTWILTKEDKPQIPALYEYKLFPNPTFGAYTLQLSFSEPTEVSVSIFNLNGILIKQFSGKDSNTYRFSGFLQHTGYYAVKIENRYKTEVMKLIVTE